MARSTRSDKGNHHESRREVPFERLDDRLKSCPDSLRYVLIAIKELYGEPRNLNRSEFLEAINDTWPPERLGVSAHTPSIFNAAEKGKSPFHYRYLEAYARLLRMPSGVLLLISRLCSDVEDGEVQQALGLLADLQRTIPELERMVSEGTIGTRSGIRRALGAFLGDAEDGENLAQLAARRDVRSASH